MFPKIVIIIAKFRNSPFIYLLIFFNFNCQHRNRFFNGNSLKLTTDIRKNDSISAIKFIGRQHSQLVHIMDQINFCYSFQVWYICNLTSLVWAKYCVFSFELTISLEKKPNSDAHTSVFLLLLGSITFWSIFSAKSKFLVNLIGFQSKKCNNDSDCFVNWFWSFCLAQTEHFCFSSTFSRNSSVILTRDIRLKSICITILIGSAYLRIKSVTEKNISYS